MSVAMQKIGVKCPKCGGQMVFRECSQEFVCKCGKEYYPHPNFDLKATTNYRLVVKSEACPDD